MESKERIWLKENYPQFNWDFEEGQIPDDQWKEIESYMRAYVKSVISEISLIDKEIIQKAKDTCPQYQGEQKKHQCDGAYQTGFVFGAKLILNRLFNWA